MRTKRLILPKPLYELIPLFYLGLGTSCLVASESVALSVLGAVFICQGLFTSVLRINYRSPHQVLNQSSRRDR